MHVKVVTNPAVESAGVDVQALMPDPVGPVTVQFIVPKGATDPVIPVTDALKTRVELRTPVPLPLSTTETGETLAIVTGVAAVAPTAV